MGLTLKNLKRKNLVPWEILATLVWGRVGSGNEWWTCG